jgi:hypothetical protein
MTSRSVLESALASVLKFRVFECFSDEKFMRSVPVAFIERFPNSRFAIYSKVHDKPAYAYNIIYKHTCDEFFLVYKIGGFALDPEKDGLVAVDSCHHDDLLPVLALGVAIYGAEHLQKMISAEDEDVSLFQNSDCLRAFARLMVHFKSGGGIDTNDAEALQSLGLQ